MSERCLQCGKELTSGDSGNVCFSCWYKNDYSKRNYIEHEMTEPKPTYHDIDEFIKSATLSFDHNVQVVIWDDPSTANKVLSINSEPLSTKQLHELIISQSMTIDRLLTDKGHYMDVMKKLYDDIQALLMRLETEMK